MRFRWLLLLFVTLHAHAAMQLKSAVSDNFPAGLQTRFIEYFSQQLGAEADIGYMTYARRLIELNDGNLDMMVGVSRNAPIGEHTVRLRPAYDRLKLGLFVLAGNEELLVQPEDITKRLLSLTRHAKSEAIFDLIPPENLVPARSLEQKIDMLLKGRIDGFFHIAPSTSLRLKELGLTEKIVPAIYQPTHVYEQFVAINTNSWLFAHRAALEAIIESGIANGDFDKIRHDYYADNN